MIKRKISLLHFLPVSPSPSPSPSPPEMQQPTYLTLPHPNPNLNPHSKTNTIPIPIPIPITPTPPLFANDQIIINTTSTNHNHHNHNHHHNNNNNSIAAAAPPPPPITSPPRILETITPPLPPTSTSKPSNGGGANQACAACKYQRRKCAPDCILAPYFPHDRTRQFLNAHRLFGVSNITKIIKNLNPPDKDEAMRTIIFQSDVRAADPVGGCYQIIRDLQRQIDFLTMELELVLHQLAICHGAEAAAAAAAAVTTLHHHLPPPPPPPPDHLQHQHPSPSTTLPPSAHEDSSSPPINLDPFDDTYNHHVAFHHHHHHHHHHQAQAQAHMDDVPAGRPQQAVHQHDDQESVLSNDHNHTADNNHQVRLGVGVVEEEEEKYIINEQEDDSLSELPLQMDVPAAWIMQPDLPPRISTLQQHGSMPVLDE